MAAGGIALPFEYPPERVLANDWEALRKLRGNTDTLFYHENRRGERLNLILYSTLLREWLDVLRHQYPELQETKLDDDIILQPTEGEGTITLYLSVKVMVHGRELMERFERDFLEMKQMVGRGINRTDNGARTFQYPRGLSSQRKKEYRDEELRDNEDTLFSDTNADGTECNYVFYSKRVLEWLDEMMERYPELPKHTQDNLIKLQRRPGTISLYPNIKVVVTGQLMERFERDFLQMKDSADFLAAIERLNINNEERQPGELLQQMAAGHIALPFEYPPERVLANDWKALRILRGNTDTLFYHENRRGERLNLMFYSTLLREWLDVPRHQYPELQETKLDDDVILQPTEGEGTITLYPSAKVLVYGQQLMERFERDFLEMKQMVGRGINGTDNGARTFEYPRGLSSQRKKEHRDEELHGNEDTLFCDTKADGTECNYVFYSKRVLEWLDEMTDRYPEIPQRIQDNLIKLRRETQPGTISIYPNIKVVVTGQLMEGFERDFLQMRQEAKSARLLAAMGGLNINNEE